MASRFLFALATLATLGSCALSSEQMRNSFQSIQESIDEALSGAPQQVERKFTIDLLMKSVQQSDKMDGNTEEALVNISRILISIIDNLFPVKGQHATAIQTAIDTITACNDDQVGVDTTAEGASNDRHQEHEDCRVIEAQKFVTDATKCGAVTSFLEGLDNIKETCTFTHAHLQITKTIAADGAIDYFAQVRSVISEWDKVMSEITTYFEQQATFTPLHEQCTAADSAWSSQKGECDLKQNTYETDYCFWANIRHDRCDALPGCYSDAHGNYENLKGDFETQSAERVSLIATIGRILCLIDNLVNNSVYDLTACNDHPNHYPLASVEATYGFTADAAPSQDECVYPTVAPNSPAFKDAKYGNINQDQSPTRSHEQATTSCP